MAYDDRETALDHEVRVVNGEVRCWYCADLLSKPVASKTKLRTLALIICEHDCEATS